MTGSPYAYIAREFDHETGLLHFRARAYNSINGIFIKEDLVGSNPNLYEYAAGNPLKFIDPFGARPILGGEHTQYGYADRQKAIVDGNIEVVNAMNEEGQITQWLWYANMVRDGGPWDYKHANRDLRAFGDMHYGATASALGIGEGEVLWFAGAWQFGNALAHLRLKAIKLREYGTPLTGPPWGDDPVYVPYIRAGIRHYKQGKGANDVCEK